MTDTPRPLFAGCPHHPKVANTSHDYMGGMSNYGDKCDYSLSAATQAEIAEAALAIPGARTFTTPRPTLGPWLNPGTYAIVPMDPLPPTDNKDSHPSREH